MASVLPEIKPGIMNGEGCGSQVEETLPNGNKVVYCNEMFILEASDPVTARGWLPKTPEGRIDFRCNPSAMTGYLSRACRGEDY